MSQKNNSLGALEQISPSPVPHHSAVLNNVLPLRRPVIKNHAIWDIVRGPTAVEMVVGVNWEHHLVLATGEGEFSTVAKVMGIVVYHAEREN